MKKVIFISLLILLVACDAPRSITSPSPILATTMSEVSAVDPSSSSEPPIVTTPSTPVIPTPPAPTPTRPFTRTDCDFSNLSAVRCFNPSGEVLVLSAAVGSTDSCDNWKGTHENVVIPPWQNGYFTLPQPNCGESLQLDFFRGPRTGSCRNPDFTAERVYLGDACPVVTPPVPTPPAPTPPPVCIPRLPGSQQPGCWPK